MPQSKGTVTWLNNVKQDAPNERVRLDNSRARIENKRIDHEHGQEVETIWLRHHRNKADMKYEIKRAREEADRWRRMRLHLDKNRVRSAMESRRAERQLLKQQAEDAKYTIIDSDGQVLHSNSNGNSKSTEQGYQAPYPIVHMSKGFRTSSFGNGHFKSPEVLSSDDEEDFDYDVFTRRHSRKGSRAPKPPVIAKPESYSKQKQGRSKSTSYIRSRTSVSRSSTSSEHDLYDNLYGKHGRSFQELKDLTHIDRITDNIKEGQRNEILKVREMHRAQENARLQKRIETFYVEVENLKRRLTPAPKQEDKLKPLRITSWS